MRKKLLSLLAGTMLLTTALAQSHKPDHRPTLLKEDPNNEFRSDEISTIDLLHALEVAGISLFKFDLGRFDRPYDFRLLADLYQDGAWQRTDTLLAASNQYAYFEKGTEAYFLDYISQLKIISRTDDNAATLHIRIPSHLDAARSLALEKTAENQFFVWRRYLDTHWEPDRKVPLLVFASSWKDERSDYHRFCGVVHLREGEAGTEELLSSSPQYYVISYQVTSPE